MAFLLFVCLLIVLCVRFSNEELFGTDSFSREKRPKKLRAAGRPVWPKKSKERAKDQRHEQGTSRHKKNIVYVHKRNI